MKPYEVEILVAGLGETPEEDELFHILYDGTVQDEEGYTVLGGQTDVIDAALKDQYKRTIDRAGAVRLGASVLSGADQAPLAAAALEVALLDRTKDRRAFQRVKGADLEAILSAK